MPYHLPDLSYLERYRSIIPDFDAFMAASRTPVPTTFWLHPERMEVDDFREFAQKHGLSIEQLPWSDRAFRYLGETPLGTRFEFKTGLIHIQEEVSMLPPLILDPQPGERVLDMCAAPGNKTTQMGLMMKNRGTLVACDIAWPRLRALRNNQERLGVYNISVLKGDAGALPHSIGDFDRILVDAPCSCEGNTRKMNSVVKDVDDAFRERLVRKQKHLLMRGLRGLRRGGKLVYSTCTYAPEENEMVVDWALTQMKGEIELLVNPLKEIFCAPGITEWNGQCLDQSVVRGTRFFPHYTNTGGFFVALMQRL